MGVRTGRVRVLGPARSLTYARTALMLWFTHVGSVLYPVRVQPLHATNLLARIYEFGGGKNIIMTASRQRASSSAMDRLAASRLSAAPAWYRILQEEQ